MREQIRDMIRDAHARRSPRTAAGRTLSPAVPNQPINLGAHAVRWAQVAAALHNSQAAPLLALNQTRADVEVAARP